MARTKAILLRLSEEEYALLKELAGREPMNAYLRRMALGEQEDGVRDPATLQALKDAWDSPALTEQFEQAQMSKWFCSTCNKLSTVPRCASNPSHKVTPA